jgi:hypothetical protein
MPSIGTISLGRYVFDLVAGGKASPATVVDAVQVGGAAGAAVAIRGIIS